MSLESMRSRNKNGKLNKIIQAMSKTSVGRSKGNDDQEDTYYPERDKNGNGSCIIRFLPGLDSEDNPYYIERFQHGFQANNKWLIEFCPKTIDKPCPVCDDTWDIINQYGNYNDCPTHIQEVVKSRGYLKGYRSGNYCNVLVIKDPMNPENEGKVHLFNFGKGILNMIIGMAQPLDDGLGEVPEPVDVFDLDYGANFKFIINKKDGRADYSKSSFENPSKCIDFDLDSQFPLNTLKDEKLFKSYDDLKKQLDKVLNTSSKNISNSANEVVNEDKEDNTNKSTESMNAASRVSGPVENNNNIDDSEDDNMAYFRSIADECNV